MNKNTTLDIVETISVVMGVSISLQTLYTLFGIILLAFQIGLIVYRIIATIVKHIKQKEYDKIPDTLEDGIDKIKDVVDKHNGNDKK